MYRLGSEPRTLINKWSQSKNTVLYFYSDPIYSFLFLRFSSYSAGLVETEPAMNEKVHC